MATHDIEIRDSVEYLRRGDKGLTGALYLPKGEGPFPAVVALHGGGWRLATTDVYKHFAPWLASQGFVVFTPTYTSAKADAPSYPAAVQDVCAAVRFIRGKAGEFKVAPERIALMGESSGGHLASLAALAWDAPQFQTNLGEFSHLSAGVKAAIPVYGVLDLAAQWRWDQLARAGEHITEPFLGKSLLRDRRVYFDASPLSYVVTRPDAPAFLVVWGTQDDVVDPRQHSIPFYEALKMAKIFARSVIVEGAPHYWMADPMDEPGSFPAFLGPRLVRFLRAKV